MTIPTWLTKALAVLATIAALIGGAWLKGRSAGKTAAENTAKQEDAANAREIENLADAARAEPADDPVGVLGKTGRLRD